METVAIDNIAPNEGKVVGLKHTYPDAEERVRVMQSLINEEIDVYAEPTNIQDSFALRCLYREKHLGYIACELCHKLYPYLDEQGHTKARVVRMGQRTCLIVRFTGPKFPKPMLDRTFLLKDDDYQISPSESEMFCGYNYRTYCDLRDDYKQMLLFSREQTFDEWTDMLSQLRNIIQSYSSNYQLSPCMEDREQLADIVSIADSVIQNVAPQPETQELLDQILELRNHLAHLNDTYHGAEHYDKIVADHFLVFLRQCYQWQYFKKYWNAIRIKYGDNPSVDALRDEKTRLWNEVLLLDKDRACLLDLCNTNTLGHLAFYARLTRSEVYIFYKYIIRIIMLSQWIQQIVSNEKISLSFVINGDIKIQADQIVVNNGTIIEHLDHI